jgi:hypothetical protein
MLNSGHQDGHQAAKLRKKRTGAEEGTRTPTPLRVHGPEPCASANSATSALEMRQTTTRRGDGNYTFIVTGMSGVSNRGGTEPAVLATL